MKNNYDKLLEVIADSISAAFGISKEEIELSDSPLFDIGDISGDNVEVALDVPDFMRRYYDGNDLMMMFNVDHGEVVMHVFIGGDCTDPDMANKFMDYYMETAKHSDVWGTPTMADTDFGLMLASEFTFKDEDEFISECTKRLALFTDDSFTNELRPFIHYFKD